MIAIALHEFALRFTGAVLHFLWVGVALALVIFAVERLLVRGAAARHALHLFGMLLLAVALPVCWAMVGGSAREAGVRAPVAESGAGTAPVMGNPEPGERVVGVREAASETDTPRNPAAMSAPAVKFAAGTEPGASWLERGAPWVAGAYLAGLLAMSLRLLAGLAGTRRLRRRCERVESGIWLAAMEKMCGALAIRTRPLLAWSRDVAAPVLIGLAKPVVLLPGALASRLTPSQLEAVLAHELAHLRRLDPWAVAVQRVVETILFFHPAVWWMSRRLDRFREEACDDLVVAAGCDPADYAEALLRCSELRLERAGLSGRLAARLSATGKGGAGLRHRVLRLLGQHQRVPIRPGRAAWILGAAAVVGVALVAVSGSTVRADLRDFDIADPPGGYEKGVRVADRNHAIKVGGLRFQLAKFERAEDGFLKADLGVGEGFEVVSFRVFDHETRKFLHDSQWQQTNPDACQFHVERIGTGSRIRMKEAGGRFPEKIDLWLRIATTGRGETIVLPAVDGGAARHEGSEIVVTSLLEGRSKGKQKSGGSMIWDRSKVHDKERATTVNFEIRGDLLRGDFHFVGVKKDGTRHPMDHRHFWSFERHGRHAYVMLDVARDDLVHLELVPFKNRHKFFFNRVEVPGRVLPELSAEQRREVKRLVERGVGARDDAEQNEIVEALVGMGPGVAPEMIPLLRSGGSDVVGMRVLKRLAADAVVQDLLVRTVGEARDRHPNVVHCGLLALGSSGNRKHVDFIAGFLPTSGIAAIGALRELGGDQARDHLIAAFETVPPERWFLVAGALEDLGDPAAVPELKRRLAQVDVPPGDDFPVAMVSAMTEAIASLSGREMPGLHSFGQGQHFRYPFDGPGAPKTFSVAPPQDHYASLPTVDPDTTEGRAAIWRALEEITKGPGFTIDGDEIVLFNGLRAAALWPDGRPYPTTLYDWLRRTSHQEILQVVRQGDRGTRQPIPLNSPLAALDPEGNLYVLELKQTSPEFVYEVSIEPLDPSRQLVPPQTDPQSVAFTEWGGCTLHDLESGQKDGCLNLSRGHMDTLTEERWRTELTDALLSVEYASGGMALAVGGAEKFRLVEVGETVAGNPQQVVRRLRDAVGTDPDDGHEVNDDGGIVHVLPEGAKGRTYAFAVAMPLGLPVAGVIEIGEADHKAATLRIRQRFLPTRAAREVFGIEEGAAVIENDELSIIDTSGNHLRAISDENGGFRFDAVPAGDLQVYYPWEGPIQGEIDSGRWKQWTLPGQQYPQPPVADRAWGKTIRLTEGETRGDIVVDLSKSSARIDGQVIDAAGQPVAGASVRAVAKLENDSILSWPDSFDGGHDTTDADGRFRLSGLPPGTIRIPVRHQQLESPQKTVEIALRAAETARPRIAMRGTLGLAETAENRVRSRPMSPRPRNRGLSAAVSSRSMASRLA